MRRRPSLRVLAPAECRREDYDHVVALLGLRADAIDERLHAERLDAASRERRFHRASLGDLPDGAFVLNAGEPWLVCGDELLRWTPAGYAEREPRPASGQAVLITPPSLVAILRSGLQPVVPLLHPSAA